MSNGRPDSRLLTQVAARLSAQLDYMINQNAANSIALDAIYEGEPNKYVDYINSLQANPEQADIELQDFQQMHTDSERSEALWRVLSKSILDTLTNEGLDFTNPTMLTAELCANVNAQLNKAYGQSAHDWAHAEQWEKDATIAGIKHAIENPNAPISAQHDAWMAEKISNGWTYGEVKDARKKTHPCIVPYEQLPAHEKFKDLVFNTIVQHFENPLSVIKLEDALGLQAPLMDGNDYVRF